MSGFTDLGTMLAGGVEPVKQDAYYKGQLQRANVEHLSAQTQGALAEAKVNQMKAKQAQVESDAVDNLADALLATGAAKSPEEAQGAATILRSGKSNFPQLTEGQGHIQTNDFRRVIADPNASQEERLRASSGIQGKVQVTPDGQDPSITKYNFSQSLPPEKREAFDTYAAPPKFINAAGVPYQAPRGGKPAVAVVSPEETARNAATIAGAKTEATGKAKIKLDQPQAQQRLAASDQKADSIIKFTDEIANDKDLSSAVGLGKPLSVIWGTKPLAVRAKIQTLKNKIALAVITDLRATSKTGASLGNISDKDVELVKGAIGALDERMSPEDFIEQLKVVSDYMKDIKERTHDGYEITYGPGGQVPPQGAPAPGASPTPRAMSAAERAKALGGIL